MIFQALLFHGGTRRVYEQLPTVGISYFPLYFITNVQSHAVRHVEIKFERKVVNFVTCSRENSARNQSNYAH